MRDFYSHIIGMDSLLNIDNEMTLEYVGTRALINGDN
jgi:hypothetical protein